MRRIERETVIFRPDKEDRASRDEFKRKKVMVVVVEEVWSLFATNTDFRFLCERDAHGHGATELARSIGSPRHTTIK